MDIREKILLTVDRYSMLEEDDRIAVAFSGGADSCALLFALVQMGYSPSAIHVNHGIRGVEADRDEAFCRDFCKKQKIPFFLDRINVPLEAKKSGEGLEEAARRLRYAAIEKIKSEEGFTKVATAHHADDNMETLLFNLTRGSCAKGAGGIPPVRDFYIRPLIACTREEIIQYCKAVGINYVTDSTNADTDYTRNFIRHRITPLLKEINPAAASAFYRFSSAARRDNELLEQMAGQISEDTTRQELSSLHEALLTRYIYRRCAEFDVVPNTKSCELLVQMIADSNEYHSVDMGKNLCAVCDRDKVYFEKKDSKKTSLEPTALVAGENDLGSFGKIYLTKDFDDVGQLQNIYKNSIHTVLKFDKIKDNIFVRSRIEGDRYRYGNMTRSLKKLFNDRKIPVNEREKLPIVCDGKGILWIPGFPLRDDVCPGKNDSEILFIVYCKHL